MSQNQVVPPDNLTILPEPLKEIQDVKDFELLLENDDIYYQIVRILKFYVN